METLISILDWQQILNSMIGSVIAVLILGPSTFFVIQKVAGLAIRYRVTVAAIVTASGAALFAILVGPSLYKDLSLLSQARTWGGNEPQPRIALSCAEFCEAEISLAAGECLDSNVQFNSERVGEYGSRNRAGLRTFIFCMENFGYIAARCDSDSPNCISVPDTGYRNPGSTIHYSANCTTMESGEIVCEYVGDYE